MKAEGKTTTTSEEEDWRGEEKGTRDCIRDI